MAPGSSYSGSTFPDGGKSMNWSERRLDVLRRLLAHVRERLAFDVGFVLWDGSTVPADLGPSELAIVITDEGVVAALIRRPNVDTFLNLWVTARLDIRNGTMFDIRARRTKARTKENANAGQALVLATAEVPVRAARRAVAARGRSRRRGAQGRKRRRPTRRTSTITTTSRMRSTRSFSIPRWSTPAPISPTGTTISRPRSATSST